MNELTVGGFKRDRKTFEEFAHENGEPYWLASDLMRLLGYDSFQSFKGAINKAIGICMTLDISVAENFIETASDEGIKQYKDFRLSRFACYLTAMNADIKKPQVAAAQAYFITLAEAFRRYIKDAGNIERVRIRGEVSIRERSLSGVAYEAGVQNYPLFQNAGYRGMYNMNMGRLKEFKGMRFKGSLLDFMGREELAANLFRITQTELKIKSENVRGQRKLEVVAENVGQRIRTAMIEISGINPEDLPLVSDIKVVRKGLKETQREFKQLDSKRKRK